MTCGGTLRPVTDDAAVDEPSAPAQPAPPQPPQRGMPRLEILKTLGDNTRYAIYLELARSARPLTTADVADTLDLHPNTVRPHLERMRDLGLVEVSSVSTGSVGRPQHRYAIAATAPSLGLEPPMFPMLAGVLLAGAAAAGLDGDDLAGAARAQGAADAARLDGDVIDDLEQSMVDTGFDPARADVGDATTIVFTHCPFRELAESHPDLVCAVHRGMVEGFVGCRGGAEVTRFHPLVDRDPCQVELARG